MNVRISFLLCLIFCIAALFYEKMQFASWGRISKISNVMSQDTRLPQNQPVPLSTT